MHTKSTLCFYARLTTKKQHSYEQGVPLAKQHVPIVELVDVNSCLVDMSMTSHMSQAGLQACLTIDSQYDASTKEYPEDLVNQ